MERSIKASETWTAPSHGCQKARPRPVTFAMLCLREAATASNASNVSNASNASSSDPSHVAWEATCSLASCWPRTSTRSGRPQATSALAFEGHEALLPTYDLCTLAAASKTALLGSTFASSSCSSASAYRLSRASSISALVRFAQPYDSRSRPSPITCIFRLSLTGMDTAAFATPGLYKASAPHTANRLLVH